MQLGDRCFDDNLTTKSQLRIYAKAIASDRYSVNYTSQMGFATYLTH
ncbi:MAG: hypothetical protein HWQ35_30575 [Nostoc sp. NMS1]|nr:MULTISPECIES: hypothetical protein [unclassified Nostoc]MBN3910726.1 hypothetical protein [Nostoc sp. NMS1]